MFADFLDFLVGGAFDFVEFFLGLLPQSPLNEIVTTIDGNITGNLIQEVLNWVNWFLPLDTAGTILFVWTTALLVYISIKTSFNWGEKVLP